MTTAADPIRHSIVIDVPPERAFRVFTEQFDAIKPHEHNLLASPIVETVLEPHVGGHIYDRGADGSVCAWADILVIEPPRRIVFSWNIGPTWQLEADPAHRSEVEVTFTKQSTNRTLVELEHRHLERHGEGWPAVAAGVSGDGGWPLYFSRYAAAVDAVRA